ncbi:transglutaminase-like putative cysteine protease [Paenibacillus sacheonensis]|nr:transglutaminase-like putative cysteine protease [Paenibacillus sacheonensis]
MMIRNDRLEAYALESEEVDFSDPAIAAKAEELTRGCADEMDYVQRAYRFVRDEVAHSWDIRSRRITRTASEVLTFGEGICYAKSNLLCALLRSKGIPAGFCYQRLTLGDTQGTGYCVHALNAVFIASEERWVRLDARGNKAGIQAEFSLDAEKLAFPVREHEGEIDYPGVYAWPNSKTMDALKQYADCINMYLHGLPSSL